MTWYHQLLRHIFNLRKGLVKPQFQPVGGSKYKNVFNFFLVQNIEELEPIAS